MLLLDREEIDFMQEAAWKYAIINSPNHAPGSTEGAGVLRLSQGKYFAITWYT